MNNREERFVQRINDSIHQCEVLLFITRCSNLQRTALDIMHEAANEAAEAKKHAIDEGNDEYANILLGLQCVIAAVTAELHMYLALKDEDPDAAWDHLIGAQDALEAAGRAHRGFQHCEKRWELLQTLEKTVFPPQVYTSVGTIVHKMECSICGENYEQCEHLAGLPYMGEFCCTIVTSAELDHVSVVEAPADKRCRVTTFGSKGVQRNRMTWREEGRVEGGQTEDGGSE